MRLRQSLIGPARQVEVVRRLVREGRKGIRRRRVDRIVSVARAPSLRRSRAPRPIAPQLRAQLLQGCLLRVRRVQARLGEGCASERRARGVESSQEQVHTLVAASVGAAGFDSADVEFDKRASLCARDDTPRREVRAAPRRIQLLPVRQTRLPRRVRRAVLRLGERDVPPPAQVEKRRPGHADVVSSEEERRARVGEIVSPRRVSPRERTRCGGADGGHGGPERLLEDHHRAPRERSAVPVAAGDRRAHATRRRVERGARQRVAASGGERLRRRQ